MIPSAWPKEKRVTGEKLVGLVFCELVVKVRVRPSTLLDFSHAAWVLHQAIHRHVFRDDYLSHSPLPTFTGSGTPAIYGCRDERS